MRYTNVITIEKDIPIPPIASKGEHGNYRFVNQMQVGDSFVINGNTPFAFITVLNNL